MRSINIHIGTPVNTAYFGEDLYLKVKYYGCYGLFSKTRAGKTALAKHIATQISRIRKTIIFDPERKWGDVTTYGKGKYKAKMTDVHTIENFGFLISQFNTSNDWYSLGFTELGSFRIMARLASLVEYHKNNIERFSQMIDRLPDTKYYGWEQFCSTYPNALSNCPQSSVTGAIKGQWDAVKSYFVDEKEHYEKGKKRAIKDWIAEIKKDKNIIIFLDVTNPTEEAKARGYVGKILEYLKPALWKLQPVLIFEEIEYLFPAISRYATRVPTSVNLISEYMLALPKRGVVIFFIGHDTDKIFDVIFKHLHYYILGIMPHGDKLRHYTEYKGKVILNPDNREFMLVDWADRKVKFRVDECCCKC